METPQGRGPNKVGTDLKEFFTEIFFSCFLGEGGSNMFFCLGGPWKKTTGIFDVYLNFHSFLVILVIAKLRLKIWPQKTEQLLGGGWTNPFEKYARQIGSFRQGSGWQ